MNFKDHFSQYMSLGTGKKHHQTVDRVTKMGDRKSLNFVAKSQSQQQRSEHPKIDLCLKTKKDIPLTLNDAEDIMTKRNTYPTPEEPIKSFKKLPVSIQYIKPNVYVLRYNKEENNKWRL